MPKKKPGRYIEGCVSLPVKYGPYISEMGRSRQNAICPWCDEHLVVFVWSLNGNGKRCTRCGAKLTRDNDAFHFKGFNGRGNEAVETS